MTIEEMRKRKKQLGYSNVQLSNLTDIPLGTLNKILSGATKSPRPENLKALEQVLQDTTYQYGYVSAAPFMVKEEAPVYDTVGKRVKRLGEFTIEDYYEIPDERRVELINGVFFDMPTPSVEHQLLTGSVYSQFLAYIRRKKGPCVPLISPVDVKLDADNKTMVQPDVVVVCNKSQIQERIVEGGPDFVMEVVSPSSIMKDYVRKTAKYLEAGVKEYWIADPLKKTVLVYRFEESEWAQLLPLAGKVPVGIYHGDLEIDFDEYKELLGE